MAVTKVRVVDVYPYRLNGSDVEYLLLRRSNGAPYARQWRMVGGKIEPGEKAWQTALRELLEETGMHPSRLWAVPSANVFYEWEHDRVNVTPAFAAQVTGEPEADDEHDAHVWLPSEEAANRLEWPEQRRLLLLTTRMIDEGIPPELVVRIEESLSW